jgi:hypothetical protein
MHRQTLMRYINAGEVYATMKGGKWFVDKQSLDSFFLADKVEVARCLGHAV